MQRKTYEEVKELFVMSYHNQNWSEAIIWSTELLSRFENNLQAENYLSRIWDNRGTAIQQLGHYLDAIVSFDKALETETNKILRARIYCNRGAAYYDMGNIVKAKGSLFQAIELEEVPQALLTLGNAYKHEGNIEKALAYYRRSSTVDPQYADGHFVYGMALLSVGHFQEGWKEYDWRWKTNQLPARKMKCPQWNGEDLTNKTILVYGEQGLGDIIQFSRYANILANRYPKAKVIVEGRPQLKRLLETIPNIYAVISVGEKLPELDYAVPMMTLAGILTPIIESIPSRDREFYLDYRDVDAWSTRFKELPKGLKIGVCWAGLSRRHQPAAVAIDAIRSTELKALAPLAKIPGIVWVSLQQGNPADEIKTPPAGMTIADWTEDMYDFYETCCAIENCDLVISVDTAVVHAAASLGKPTWLLSRWDGCWRWFGTREDSPWYPSLRQFTQPAPGDWNGMLQKVAKELAVFVESHSKPELDLTLAK